MPWRPDCTTVSTRWPADVVPGLPADALPVENAFCAFSHCEGRETARRWPACGECVLCFFTLWGQGDCPPMPCLWRMRSVLFHTVRAERLHAMVLPSPHLSTFFFLFRFWKKSEQSVNACERQEGERVEAEMVLDKFSSQDYCYKNVTVERMKVTKKTRKLPFIMLTMEIFLVCVGEMWYCTAFLANVWKVCEWKVLNVKI